MLPVLLPGCLFPLIPKSWVSSGPLRGRGSVGLSAFHGRPHPAGLGAFCRKLLSAAQHSSSVSCVQCRPGPAELLRVLLAAQGPLHMCLSSQGPVVCLSLPLILSWDQLSPLVLHCAHLAAAGMLRAEPRRPGGIVCPCPLACVPFPSRVCVCAHACMAGGTIAQGAWARYMCRPAVLRMLGCLVQLPSIPTPVLGSALPPGPRLCCGQPVDQGQLVSVRELVWGSLSAPPAAVLEVFSALCECGAELSDTPLWEGRSGHGRQWILSSST